ncbi:hypothetical protein HMPREF1250_1757 [Megasphaera vaginalis (ex Srinivasan et al. 2021)]|uniref:Uncharacterized protein n=1 Tax=Megasphaera vaginalis (ex Srinivasan et al. 2021) TaxID=1111454 RepID=U7UCG1_9FIRM|nr:hypothetical protein HMPREF1250_1757 [Megasphaera vaginalis (ex Srinivasan et al. 2021)]
MKGNIDTKICLNFIYNKIFLKALMNQSLFCRTGLKNGESGTSA